MSFFGTVVRRLFSVEYRENVIRIVILGIKIKIRTDNGCMPTKECVVSNVLANYRFFEPVTDKIKVYLLNDTTREEGHLGCRTVIGNIKTLCAKNGMDIVFYDAEPPSEDESVDAYADVLRKCDIVLFNGEGSLHDDAAANMYAKCRLAKELGKKVVLLNSVWQNNKKVVRNLELFDLAAVRESRSYREMAPFCRVKPLVVPDLAFYGKVIAGRPDAAVPPLVFTDSVKASSDRLLRRLAQKYHGGFYRMQVSGEEGIPLLTEEAVSRWPEGTKLVTGRFHALVFAMKHGIPALALASNTHKIEGLLEDSGLENYLASTRRELQYKLKDFAAERHDNFRIKAENYVDEAQQKIEDFFVKIRNLF